MKGSVILEEGGFGKEKKGGIRVVKVKVTNVCDESQGRNKDLRH